MARGPVLLALAGSLALGACDGRPRAAATSLWLAESLGPTGRVHRRTEVCADGALREGFERPEPVVNGEACRTSGKVVERPGLRASRCKALGRSFGVTVTARGDPARDLTMRYALTPMDGGGGPLIQTVRYRLIGVCPRGWRPGDERDAG